MYCPNCQMLMDGDRCTECRRACREPRETDAVLLAEKDHPWSDILCDVLKQDDIPFLRQSNLGSGLATYMSQALEVESIYVLYAHYERAQEIRDGLFSENVEILWNEDDQQQ